jgi:hypothetical protein
MPGRTKRQPSGRNLELYYELVCEGRSQAEVAARFRISQPRVAQLHGEVAAWIEGLLPDAAQGLPDAANRLHLAVVLQRVQLAAAYGEYLAHFGGVSGATGLGHLLAAGDAGALPQEVAVRLPPRRLVQTAVRMARELTELDRIAKRGPLLPVLIPEAT